MSHYRLSTIRTESEPTPLRLEHPLNLVPTHRVVDVKASRQVHRTPAAVDLGPGPIRQSFMSILRSLPMLLSVDLAC